VLWNNEGMPPSRRTAPDAAIVTRITDWFAREGRDLPWRRPDCTPWGVLVSEIMLQQTPVARVLPVWVEWLRRWPTPPALAKAPGADAVRAWGRLGYPRRALRLWDCAVALERDHGGEVPRGYDELRALPGVGDYTAAAVAAFAFGQRAVVLDTNVRRVIGRIWHAQALPAAHLTRAERDFAATLVPFHAAASATWNAAAMELGALICTARNPRCEECPARASCLWVAAGKPPAADGGQTRSRERSGARRVRAVAVM